MGSVLEQFREFLRGEHKSKRLYHYLGCSSGAPVSDKIPVLLGRRAGWATRQGANFIELFTGPPSELIMEKEELINTAARLGLNYSIHPSEQLGLDSSYVMARNGYLIAQEYLRKIIIYAGLLKLGLIERFKKERLNTDEVLTSINIHISNKPIPPFAEKLAGDVSLDPFGNDIRKVRLKNEKGKEIPHPIFSNKLFRERLWKHYILPNEDKLILVRLLAEKIARKPFEKIFESYFNNLLQNQQFSEDEEKNKEIIKKEMAFPFDIRFKRHTNLQTPAVEHTIQDKNMFKAVEKSFIEKIDGIEILWGGRVECLNPDKILQESFLFRELLPRWMPHAKEKPIRDIWEGIVGKKYNGSEKDVTQAEKKLIKHRAAVRGEQKIIAASAGAYTWGHLTQYTDWAPGVPEYDGSNKKKPKKATLAELLAHFKIQITLECHMSGGLGETIRIFAPEDVLVIAKAVNETKSPLTKKTYDIARITIDMEQISTMGVDPIWMMKGDKAQGFKGLSIKKQDGKFIRVVHVTHPYIMMGGSGHQHGPIRRGDTQVFKYLYLMNERGMGSRENEKTIIMYEIGTEKAESVFMIRLMIEMIEAGITPKDLKVENIQELMDKEPRDLKEKLIQEFFGLSEAEMRQEWAQIQEHTTDPLKGMLGSTKPDHTWTGKAALDRRNAPEEYKGEQYK